MCTTLNGGRWPASDAAAVKLANIGPLQFRRLLDNLGAGFEVLNVMLGEQREKRFLKQEAHHLLQPLAAITSICMRVSLMSSMAS